ncbi:SCO family protein [Emcibacter sp.]|uniref:SCO family protein n=1 Tax=Emcibacter sp. TaxID=1979954 RepID=UPI003A944DDF
MSRKDKTGTSGNRLFQPLAILVAIAIVAVTAVWLISVMGDRKEEVATATSSTKALIGGPFTLVDHTGKTITEKDFAGSYMLVYFGYTFCPDVCPTELQAMSTALDMIPSETLAKINPLFVTVDPERDTVDVMRQYVALFHENLTGLTGSVEQIDAVKKTFRVYAEKTESTAASDYLVDHTSIIYLMDSKGEYLSHFSYGTTPEEMAAKLVKLIPQD